MLYQVEIDDTRERYLCTAGETLLAGMERLGRSGIPVGCRGGGCGVCKVRITAGDVLARKMSRAHVSPEELAGGVVLACRCRPQSDIRLTVLGALREAAFQQQAPKREPD
jgi:ferredoxin